MQEFLDKHWKKLFFGGIISSAAVLMVYLSTEDSEQKNPKSKPPAPGKKEELKEKPLHASQDDASRAQKVPKIEDETIFKIDSFLRAYSKKDIQIPSYSDQKPEEVAKTINVLFDEDSLDLMTISQIFEKSVDLGKREYVRLAYENRKARRQYFFDNKKKYTTLVIEFLEECENIINKASDDLLVALNIPKELFENSCMTLMDKGFFQQMMMLQTAVRQKMKEFLVSTKPLTLAEVKKLLKDQLTILKDNQSEFVGLIDSLKTNMETVQMIPLGINVILSDLIYDRYGIEEEDQMSALKDPYAIMQDQELHNVLMASEQQIQQMLGGMGLMGGMSPDMMGGPEGAGYY